METERAVSPVFFVAGAIAVVLLQIPMAYLGTHLGWADGTEVGVQTYFSGRVFGIGSGILFSIFALTVGLRWYRKNPVTALATLIVLAGLLCATTVVFSLLRASASFLLHLDP